MPCPETPHYIVVVVVVSVALEMSLCRIEESEAEPRGVEPNASCVAAKEGDVD